MSNTLTNSCTNLSVDHIKGAKSALANYRVEMQRIVAAMKADVEAMVGTDFIGEAATAYKITHHMAVEQLAGKIYGEDTGLLAIVEMILDDAQQQMNNYMDPQLANENRNAAQNLTPTSGVVTGAAAQ